MRNYICITHHVNMFLLKKIFQLIQENLKNSEEIDLV